MSFIHKITVNNFPRGSAEDTTFRWGENELKTIQPTPENLAVLANKMNEMIEEIGELSQHEHDDESGEVRI